MNIQITINKSKRVNSDYSLFLSFRYDPNLLEQMRSLNTRYWHPDLKCWEVPYDYLPKMVAIFKDHNIEIIGEKPETKVVEKPSEFEFKTKPFQHQLEGFNYGLNNDRWLLGDEQGLGKTKQAIDIAVAKKLQRGYKHCLIICGVNGLKWNWENEIKIHSNESAKLLGSRIKADKVVVEGNSAKLADLNSLDSTKDYFLIINIEALRTPEIQAKITELCKARMINMIVADEVHKMKNPTSQQGRAFLKIQAETMIAMSGTPLMNNPLDLYIILKWLGFENHSFYQFKMHYCNMGGYGGYEIVGYKNLGELQERLDRFMLRRLKSDVLDLPDKIEVEEIVEMTGKQEQIYKEVKADITAHIDEIKLSNNPLTELIRLRQATGFTGILSSTIQESAKLDRMEEIVENAVANGKKVVVFSNWTKMTDEVYKRLHPKYHPAIITGQTDADVRQDEVWHFQNDDDCKVIIGTIGAMGTGLTLTAGTVEIFLDEPWNKALKDQAEDRCHRVGTKENVTIYTLICKDTIDEKIHSLVEKKGKLANLIIDGELIGNRSEVVDYLLS